MHLDLSASFPIILLTQFPNKSMHVTEVYTSLKKFRYGRSLTGVSNHFAMKHSHFLAAVESTVSQSCFSG
jgi:hypothetical protein